ncbi:MAG: OsmC family protein [Flavobacteriales bacterium]|nr:OsmC family protein [Flavobacteriales bacterium]MCZ2443531.1 OsmC family protein [Flavobacteriales bacterium]
MSNMTLKYTGDLRCELTHYSGVKIYTDAPVDNHGKGESFSPTDLMCSSMAACMVTIMGIEAQKLNVPFSDVYVDIKKIMVIQPRKIGRIELKVHMPEFLKDHPCRVQIEQAGLNCPIALSIHPDLILDISFIYP